MLNSARSTNVIFYQSYIYWGIPLTPSGRCFISTTRGTVVLPSRRATMTYACPASLSLPLSLQNMKSCMGQESSRSASSKRSFSSATRPRTSTSGDSLVDSRTDELGRTVFAFLLHVFQFVCAFVPEVGSAPPGPPEVVLLRVSCLHGSCPLSSSYLANAKSVYPTIVAVTLLLQIAVVVLNRSGVAARPTAASMELKYSQSGMRSWRAV